MCGEKSSCKSFLLVSWAAETQRLMCDLGRKTAFPDQTLNVQDTDRNPIIFTLSLTFCKGLLKKGLPGGVADIGAFCSVLPSVGNLPHKVSTGSREPPAMAVLESVMFQYLSLIS